MVATVKKTTANKPVVKKPSSKTTTAEKGEVPGLHHPSRSMSWPILKLGVIGR